MVCVPAAIAIAGHIDAHVEHAPIGVAGHDGRAPACSDRSGANRGAYAGLSFFEEEPLCMRRCGGQGKGKKAEARCLSHRRFLQRGRHICTAGRALQALKLIPDAKPRGFPRFAVTTQCVAGVRPADGLRVALRPSQRREIFEPLPGFRLGS